MVGLTVALFTFLDILSDPVALQGEGWFLGKIYGYPQEALSFGVPLTNFGGWAVLDSSLFLSYCWLKRSLYASEPVPREVVKRELLLGIGLYYSLLALSLSVTFWIGETLMGIVGAFVYFPLTAVLLNASWLGLSWSGVNEP